MICGCFPSLFFLQPGNVPITSSIFLKPQTFLQIVRLIFFDFYPLFFSPQITRLLHTTNLKGKMHCLSRQCILKVAAGCHFTDPIALRLSLSTNLPMNLFLYYIVHFSLKLPIINISSLLAQECSYQQALQHEHSFQQKEPFVYLLRKHWPSSQ